MAIIGGGTMGGLAGAAGQAAGAGQGGSGGPRGGPKGGGVGGSGTGLSTNPGNKENKKLPKIPDTRGGAIDPEPVDLSLLAGEEKPPERRPLNANGIGGSLLPQTGITGYAGLFIPALLLAIFI